jgi:hypothetical protein
MVREKRIMIDLTKKERIKCYCGHTNYCECMPEEEMLKEEFCYYSSLPSPLAYEEIKNE